jgi:hypothetical protein
MATVIGYGLVFGLAAFTFIGMPYCLVMNATWLERAKQKGRDD